MTNPQLTKPYPKSFLVLLTLLFLFSGNPALADNEISEIRVSSRLDFNAILITEVDLVFVYDQQLADQLPKSKGEWYAQKYDLLRNKTSGLEVITISAPQGFNATGVSLPEKSRTAVNVFAVGYHEDQQTPVHNLNSRKRVLVEIDQFGLLVSEQPD